MSELEELSDDGGVEKSRGTEDELTAFPRLTSIQALPQGTGNRAARSTLANGFKGLPCRIYREKIESSDRRLSA